MHLSLLTAVFALWLLVNVTGSSDLKDAVRHKRENSRDQDLRGSCLWLCDCFRKQQKGHVHIVVKCQQMLQFPAVTPKRTTVLILNDNFIGRITETSLQLDSLKHLEVFECTNCRITTVDINAFRHLHKLKTVDLKDNSIAHLSPAHFIDQKNLRLLSLQGNSDLDCDPMKKELERRADNPAKVDCDVIAPEIVTDENSETTTVVTKTGIVIDKKTDTTENSEGIKSTIVTTDRSVEAGSSDTQEKVEDVTKSSNVPNEDSSQVHSETSTDAPGSKSESELVVIGSIIGTVIAVVVGVTGVAMLWQARERD